MVVNNILVYFLSETYEIATLAHLYLTQYVRGGQFRETYYNFGSKNCVLIPGWPRSFPSRHQLLNVRFSSWLMKWFFAGLLNLFVNLIKVGRNGTFDRLDKNIVVLGFSVIIIKLSNFL